MAYINIHVNQHLFLDAKHAGRFDHLKFRELANAPSAGKVFQFKTKKTAKNFLNALLAFAADYPALQVQVFPNGNRLRWIYELGNNEGFKIDFPVYR